MADAVVSEGQRDAVEAGLLGQEGAQPKPVDNGGMRAPDAPFMPDAVRAEALDLAAVIGRSRDKTANADKKKALTLEAEVFVPGLPNGDPSRNGGYGVVCTVRRFTPFERGQIAWKSREGAQLDDAEMFKVPEELSSPEARGEWWRDVWRLMYGLTKSTKRLLVAIKEKNPQASASDFTIQTAIYWLTTDEGDLTGEPLLEAINILNYLGKDMTNTTAQVDDFKALPDVLEQLMAAQRGGYLRDFITANAPIMSWVINNVKLLTELQGMVLEEQAVTFARHNKAAIKEALREIVLELHGVQSEGTDANVMAGDEAGYNGSMVGL